MFKRLFGKKPKIERTETREEDGSTTFTTSFSLGASETRPVNDDVVEAIDSALGMYGEVLHAIDPARLLTFEAGGPPVWSVGMVRVDGERPHWLLVTYGRSGVLSPTEDRRGASHELSLTLPVSAENMDGPPVWAPALLRHLARYELVSGAELSVGDNMPFAHSITRMPFPPEHHDQIPDSPLRRILVARDPLLPTIDTPRGRLEVRRMVGIRDDEARLVDTWSSVSFLEEATSALPHLWSDIRRSSLLDDPDFRSRATARAQAEGSQCGGLFLEDFGLEEDGGYLKIHLPGGSDASHLLRVLEARLTFERDLYLQGPEHMLCFRANHDFGMAFDERGVLNIDCSWGDSQLEQLLEGAKHGRSATIRIGLG